MRELLAQGLALAAFCGLTVLYLRPDWGAFGTRIAPDLGDPVLNLVLLKWVGHEAGRGFSGFWDAPFFFPCRGVLAYSDHLLGPGLAARAFTALVPSWIAAYDALLLAAFALTGWSMGFALRCGGMSWPASLAGGVMYAFSPFRWDQLSHLQVLLMAAIPLTLWSFDRLLARPGRARAGAFLACYLVHLSGGSYLAYMIHVPLLVLALNRVPELVRRGRARWRAEAPVLLATGCACAAALTATFAKHWQVAHRDGLRWHSGTASIWGATTLSYLQPSAWNLYSGHWPGGLFRPENSLFPGWLAAGLAIAGAVLFWRRRRHVPAAAATGHAAAAIGAAGSGHHRWRHLPLLLVPAGWAAADLQTWSTLPGKEGLAKWIPGQGYSTPLALVVLGVAAWLLATRRQTGRWPLSWLPAAFARPWERGLLLAGCATAALASPLFFLPASHLLPGLSAMRVPARFHAFTMFAVVWLAAATFDLLLARARSCGRFWAAGLATGAAVLLAVELAPRPISWMELPDEDDFPAVYDWLAGQDDVKALLDLPMGDVIADEVLAMYFGTLHWRPVVNGYSAHFPAPHEYARAHAWLLPDEDAREVLPCWGVTHILVHCSRLSRAERRLLALWHAAHAADLVYGGGGDRVYRLPPCGSGISPSQKRGEGMGRPAVAHRDLPLDGAPASSQPRRP